MKATRRRVLAGTAAAGLALWLPACRRESPARQPPAPSAATGLRIDLRHTIRSGEDEFAVAALRRESAAPSLQSDPPDWGDYRLTLTDTATRAVLAIIGFDSNIAADAEASSTMLTLRTALPSGTFTAIVEKRRPGGTFQTLLTNPGDPSIFAEPARGLARIDTLLENGRPRTKVDLAIVGDGYTATEHAKFIADAKRAAAYLFAVEPFKSRARDFNVRALFVASDESGVTDAYLGQRRHSAFGSAYDSGERERTLSVGDEGRLRDAASTVAYDFLLVITNSPRYGGSAYFGGPAVVAIDSAAARYLVLHELAHAIAGLAEEYYIPSVDGPVYRGNVEPWQPNITTSLETNKWATAERVPSMWNKKEYERWFANYVRRYSALRAGGASEVSVEKLMRDAVGRQAVLLGRERRTGLFEGADGYARGLYRSEPDCIMFSLQSDYYCAACTAALTRAIDAHLLK